jgi:glycosyltransferase involved in cell wall biosynthesis
MSKQIKVKWITGTGSAYSCAIVRGAIPAGIINNSKWSIEVKDETNFYPYDCKGSDILVLQRCFGDDITPKVRKCRANGMKIIFDIDDALWLLPDASDKEMCKQFGINISVETKQSLKRFLENEVDAVICSTEQLKVAMLAFCRPRKVYVVNNYVDPTCFYPLDIEKTEDERRGILWYAALGHNYNAGFFADIVNKVLSTDLNVEFTIMGCGKEFKALAPLAEYGNRIHFKEWVDYFTLGIVINTYDLVLCPIVENPFTVCKSEIKAVEVTACGIPVIMSDVPQYRRFAQNTLTSEESAISLLPNVVERWCSSIEHVVRNPAYMRKTIPRRTVAAYGPLRCIEAWISVYVDILK